MWVDGNANREGEVIWLELWPRHGLLLTFHTTLDPTCLHYCLPLSAVLHVITEKPNHRIVPWYPSVDLVLRVLISVQGSASTHSREEEECSLGCPSSMLCLGPESDLMTPQPSLYPLGVYFMHCSSPQHPCSLFCEPFPDLRKHSTSFWLNMGRIGIYHGSIILGNQNMENPKT